MTYREFYEKLAKTCSWEHASNIVGFIMDIENNFSWDNKIPEKYIKIHLI